MGRCIVCGRIGEEGTLCRECFLKQNPIIGEFKELLLVKCAHCDRYRSQNKWIMYKSVKEAWAALVRKKVKPNQGYQITDIAVEPEDVGGASAPGLVVSTKVRVIIHALAEGYEGVLSEDYFLPAKLEFSDCPHCKKSSGQYFEGKFQVRNPPDRVVDEIVDYINSLDGPVQVTSVHEVRGGADIYVNSRSLKTLAKKIQDRFGGEMKISPRLQTRDSQAGQDIYRVNVSLRFPDFGIGDVVETDGKVLQVTGMGKAVFAREIDSDKRYSFGYDVHIERICAVRKTTVSKVHPHIEVLHPETYQSEVLQGAKDILIAGQKVKVAVTSNGLYYVS
jgi:nonsense-mediated mRNA decay protein 3